MQKFLPSSTIQGKLQYWADSYKIPHLQQYLDVVRHAIEHSIKVTNKQNNLMADNTDEEHLLIATNTQSEIPLDETNSTKDTETISPNQESCESWKHMHRNCTKHQDMVLKHYFWEFLMLFLAVFCGFLAENYRETLVNKEKAHHYIQNMVADLKADTADLNFLFTISSYGAITWTVLCKCQLIVSKDINTQDTFYYHFLPFLLLDATLYPKR